MLTRILVGVVCIPLLFIALFILPPPVTALVFAVITGLASFELLRAAKALEHARPWVVLCAVLLPLTSLVPLDRDLIYLILTMLLLCGLFFQAVLAYGTDRAVRAEEILFGLFGGILIPLCLSSVVRLRFLDNGRYYVLLPVFCAFLTDAGAYFAGVFLGRHKGITRVSPNKSLEGYIGGILSAPLFLLVYGLILQQAAGLTVSLPLLVLYGLLGGAATELGDLSFSLLKREFGIKDYGHLIPGHGGMLDRFDSMIFAAPVMLILVELVPAF